MKGTKALISLISLVFSVATFYGIFFKLTPWIITFLPNNEWKHFLSLVIYIVVGYFGGIAIPLLLLVIAIWIWFAK